MSPARRRFTSSIAMCRQHARISNNEAMANAVESFGTRLQRYGDGDRSGGNGGDDYRGF
ncbi:hypothetical protein TIFTF001_018018 [Ficus carica]|uniref:Uncharacterized protein n=1 Tax=Ficus carica TaxID=3494 RepID=A0AA88AAQ3_FICCA|nr:hypothetical protein TIFTF001_018018 [Ficus carica]